MSFDRFPQIPVGILMIWSVDLSKDISSVCVTCVGSEFGIVLVVDISDILYRWSLLELGSSVQA